LTASPVPVRMVVYRCNTRTDPSVKRSAQPLLIWFDLFTLLPPEKHCELLTFVQPGGKFITKHSQNSPLPPFELPPHLSISPHSCTHTRAINRAFRGLLWRYLLIHHIQGIKDAVGEPV
jgi:hypothetical protein